VLTDDDDVVVASKAGLLRNRDGEWLPHGDPDYLHNQVLCSLDRLRTDTIDLYQLHTPDPDTGFEASVQAFAEMKDAGQIEHVGLSNVSVEQLETATDMVEIATVQNEYNVGNRDDEDVLRACEELGAGSSRGDRCTRSRNRALRRCSNGWPRLTRRHPDRSRWRGCSNART